MCVCVCVCVCAGSPLSEVSCGAYYNHVSMHTAGNFKQKIQGFLILIFLLGFIPALKY